MVRWFGLLLGVLCLQATVTQAFAQQQQVPQISYYGAEFYRRVTMGESNDGLQDLIRYVLRADHRAVPGRPDEIMDRCSGQGCYRHTVIGYNRARQFLMGYFYLVRNGNQYGVREVYCERVVGANEFRGRPPGPGQIPDDRVVNVEHTWPQSRFSGRFNKEEQKSDLHHLYPTNSQMNSTRSSFPFGEVREQRNGRLACDNGRFGLPSSRSGLVFEPPQGHKGNVARALFYFSVRYELRIDPEQEATLRQWNRMDPPDQDEIARNNEIFKAQGSRNPFIDFPQLADRIRDF
ncbi:MAG: endonuclease [Bdellovibrionaceae bacterium]|nr:endonuclease [Pseudobdellovibrionaceae bacterium]